MTSEEIDQVCIEHRGEKRYWNITMCTVPPPGNSGKVPCYADLVKTAEDVLRKVKGLGREWFVSDARVMAWSSKDDRGVCVPYRYRVALDMVTEDMEVPSDADV